MRINETKTSIDAHGRLMKRIAVIVLGVICGGILGFIAVCVRMQFVPLDPLNLGITAIINEGIFDWYVFLPGSAVAGGYAVAWLTRDWNP
jgi:hypothetical protein